MAKAAIITEAPVRTEKQMTADVLVALAETGLLPKNVLAEAIKVLGLSLPDYTVARADFAVNGFIQPTGKSLDATPAALAAVETQKRVCTICDMEKSLSAFSWMNKSKLQKMPSCRDCLKKKYRAKYLTVSKALALNEANIGFVLDKGIPGVICTVCQEPFKKGDGVNVKGKLRHAHCL